MTETLQSLIKELIKYDHKTILVDEAVDIFINKSSSTTSPDTLEYYKKYLYKIRDYLINQEVRSVSQITNNIIYKFVNQEKSRGLKNNTINKYVDCLSYALNYCYKLDYINVNPLKHYDKLPSDDVETVTVDLDVLKKIFKYLDLQPRTNVNVQNHLIFMLLIDTGIRRRELINIRIDNVDINRGTIYLTQTKTNKNRYLFLSEQTIVILKEYFSLMPVLTDYLFINTVNLRTQITDSKINWMIKKVKKDLKIQDNVSISPHKFRHTFASMSLNNGADLIHVQKLLGHSSLRITQRYLHKNNQELKSEHDKYTPLTII